ncbi:hypothetical protein DOTSEDRAFT_23221 [Dothistroma septosporum NZE10]|uniref:RING-type domain-containing protein n=1 Tax=Dothistroma septosporum (strain NZE10 / CBS 128990) TaxID=675120 RepID=N1PP25_DOTSN|nr:hypothetical protein DOTSEDRAFT_23221 [Dothistroma septosporum NZE10]
MGTLTAGQPRLGHFCEHKLPTSCRLSSIGECCACYDNRAHSASYRTYVDGVGYVLRGTRWQSYCWFCKTFWENRVDVSGLRPGQTRIPQVPDQGEFLHRWYEFHQGYRVVTKDDGSEERVAVIGEALRDVSPGILPRTIEELRAGREHSDLQDRERDLARQQQSAVDVQPSQPGSTLDDTLDQLLQAAAREETHQPQTVPLPTAQAQAMVPAVSRNREYQVRRVAALRRELHRMRNGIERVISGLRELGENVPDHSEASARLSQLGRTLDNVSDVPSQEEARRAIDSVNSLTETTQSDGTLANMQTRVDEAQREVNEAQRNREQAAAELDAADQEHRASQSRLRTLQDNLRSTENYTRLFGTREEMAAQGENYESPIGGMFTRAMERFRAAEEVRREERTLRQVLADEDNVNMEAAQRLVSLQVAPDLWGVPQVLQQRAIEQPHRERNGYIEDYHALLDRQERLIGTDSGSLNLTEVDGAPDIDFTSGMLAPVTNNRQNILSSTSAEATTNTVVSDGAVSSHTPYVGGPPGHQLDHSPETDNDHGLDAAFVLDALLHSQDSALLGSLISVPHLPVGVSADALVSRLLQGVESNSLSQADAEYIEFFIRNETVVWGVGLPAERNRRRRAQGERIAFTPNASTMATAVAPSGQIIVHDVEVMAECFQMSSQIRRRSGLSAPEHLQMLFRLQAGRRDSGDRVVLARMLRDEELVHLCERIHEQHGSEGQRERIVVQQLRSAARQGDHSRAELDAQRRATSLSTALAASRLAMGDSPAVLFERLANRDEATRAAYQRLQENGFNPARAELMATRSMTARRFRNPDAIDPPSSWDDLVDDSASEEGGAGHGDARVGLDAKDSGRPEEPMTEEEMTVLLDCRICYSQRADICTLPCGHLAMCRWCSDQHSPTMAHDATRPRRAANCPVCRKQIRQKVKVIRA